RSSPLVTLFPYTTLFRSTDREGSQAIEAVVASCQQANVRCPVFSHVLSPDEEIECEQIIGRIHRTTVVVADDMGDDGFQVAFVGAGERRIDSKRDRTGIVLIVRHGPPPRRPTDLEGSQAIEAVVASCQQAIVRCPIF